MAAEQRASELDGAGVEDGVGVRLGTGVAVRAGVPDGRGVAVLLGVAEFRGVGVPTGPPLIVAEKVLTEGPTPPIQGSKPICMLVRYHAVVPKPEPRLIASRTNCIASALKLIIPAWTYETTLFWPLLPTQTALAANRGAANAPTRRRRPDTRTPFQPT
jgi:hypothetical protein